MKAGDFPRPWKLFSEQPLSHGSCGRQRAWRGLLSASKRRVSAPDYLVALPCTCLKKPWRHWGEKTASCVCACWEALPEPSALPAHRSAPRWWDNTPLTMARRLGDPAVLAFTLKAHHNSLWGRPERINEIIASADEMLTLAEDIGDKERAFEARVWRLLCSLELGNIQAVDTELEALIRLAEEMRQPLHVYLSIGYQAMRALLEGRFADAERLAQQGLAVGQRMQGEDPSGVFGLQMFTIRREQGRLREVEPAVRFFVQQNPAALTWQPGLAVVYSELGLEQEAREMFERLAANDFAAIPRDAMWMTSMTYLAEVCAFLGDARRAAMLYQRLLPYAEHNVIVGLAIACTGAAARHLGMLATTMSRWAEAEQHFQAALEMNARIRARPYLAHTQQQYAEMLLSRAQPGDRDTALSLLDEALASASQLGMGALTDRVLAGKLRIQGSASVNTKPSTE